MKAASNALSLATRWPASTRAGPRARLDSPRRSCATSAPCVDELERRGIPLGKPEVDEYVAELRKAANVSGKQTPEASLIDRLLVAALIEARSCERFRLLADALAARGRRARRTSTRTSSPARRGTTPRSWIWRSRPRAATRPRCASGSPMLARARGRHRGAPRRSRFDPRVDSWTSPSRSSIARSPAPPAARARAPAPRSIAARPSTTIRSTTSAASSSRDTFLDLAPRPVPPREPGQPLDLAALLPRPSDDHRVALREWVFALTLDRVLWADSVRLAAARRARRDHHRSRRSRAPPDLAAGSPPSRDRRARSARVVACSPRCWSRARSRRRTRRASSTERRAEAARRLPADLDRLEIPLDPAVIEGAPAITRAPRSSRSPRTRCGRPSRSRPAPSDRGTRPSTRASGRAQAAGWPARLGSRWIEGLFHATSLTEGLRLDLGPLAARARRLVVRARARRVRRRARRRRRPARRPVHASRCAPFDLRRARRAALFGSLVADPVFGRRMLGLGRDAARDQARGVARSLAVAVRLDAARVLFRGAPRAPRERPRRTASKRSPRRRSAPRSRPRSPASSRGSRPRDATTLRRRPPRRARSPRPGRALRRGLVPEPRRGPRHPRGRRRARPRFRRARPRSTAGAGRARPRSRRSR